ncbi:S41 family peptidase [Terricaulis sp.]|uniref:S41 family peptidase n=1 Tax=Terricaulis sp. TaxID=2768686 RepID=UPI0037847079
MLTRRGVMAGAAGLALAPAAWGQSLDGELGGDIAILRRAYDALHPGLYRYTTPRQMDARLGALTRDFAAVRTRADAYLTLSRFLATIRCGHTYANFYNQSDAVQAELFDSLPLLPFHFCWLNGRMVTLANFSGNAMLGAGAEVVSIDGVPARRILRTLLPYARADGGNDAKRRALLEVRGYDRYETFDIFYGLVFKPGGSFRVRVKPPGSPRVETVDVAAIDLTARRAAMQAGASDEGPAWTLSYPQRGTALLTMPNWALYNSSWDWRGFLDASFAGMQARGVSKLICDVRGNEGGLDCGNDIIARFIDADLSREGYQRRVRYRQTPDDLNRYLDTWDRSFRNWGEDAQPVGDGWYRLRGEADVERIAPKPPRLNAELIVLTDAQNSSATFQFAELVQSNRIGRLVGQPTGGNQRGINGGAFFFLRLPACGLEADLPLIGRFPLTPKPDAGLTPDVLVAPTRADIATGRDAVLAQALAI